MIIIIVIMDTATVMDMCIMRDAATGVMAVLTFI
jgi:hypothetical protein